MTTRITTRCIIACRMQGGHGPWLYLSTDVRQRHGGYDLARFNDRAVHFAHLSELTADERKGFDGAAEDLGLGQIDWTNLRVTEIHSVRSERDTAYDALTATSLEPAAETYEDGAIVALAELVASGAEAPGSIKIETLEGVAAALLHLQRERAALRDRVEELEAAQAKSTAGSTAPLWLAATPPDAPAH